MKKFAFISDILFTFFVSALFSLCLFRFLKMGVRLSLLLATLCGALSALSVCAALLAKRKNLHLKRSDETQKQKLMLHLALLSDAAVTDFFRKLLSSPDAETVRFGHLRLYSPTDFYFLHFRLTPVSPDDVAKISRLKTQKNKTLLCSQIEEQALALCARLGIAVKTADEVYLLVKNAHALPERYLGEENQAGKRKRRIRLWFAKGNSKRFLIGGALILLTSLITPYFYYYLLLGFLLLLAAVFVRIFGYE